MNQVDTSQETVAREWERIKTEYNAFPVELPPENAGETEQAGSGELVGDVKTYTPEEIEHMQGVMTAFITGGVGMAYGVMGIDYVDDKHVKKFAAAWAVVIVKRWPDNPIGGFYEEYGDLIAAGSATLVLIGAIRNGKRVDAKQVEQRVRQQFEKEKAE